MDIHILCDDHTGNGLTEKFSGLIKKTAEQTLISENIAINAEVSVSFVDNTEIRRINQKFRRIDKATDVLSFPLIDLSKESLNSNETYELGDIVISYEKAAQQAGEYNHSIEREIAFLTAHSMLHLLGYDHMIPADEEIMFAKQEHILSALGIGRDG